jgi:hypothetical protein
MTARTASSSMPLMFDTSGQFCVPQTRDGHARLVAMLRDPDWCARTQRHGPTIAGVNLHTALAEIEPRLRAWLDANP